MQMNVHRLTRMAVLLATVVVLGLIPVIPVGLIPIPITLQNIGILLIGLFLSAPEALLTTGMFLLLAAVGLPVLTGMRGGLAVFMGPSFGYLIGYLIGAGLLAFMINRGPDYFYLNFFKIAVVSIFIIDGCGILGFMMNMHVPLQTAFRLNAIFIPVDLFKSFMLAVLYQGFYRRRHK